MEDDARYDDHWMLRTDTTYEPMVVALAYKDLWMVEALFRSMKSLLDIVGSGNLIQSLQAASLIDEYLVWTFPVVLGRGKRLFETTAKPGALRPINTKASATGVVMSTYVLAGDIPLGSFAQAEPSEK